MQILPAEKAFFHLPEGEACSYEAAKAVIIPFGLEASVSYGGGTSKGPQAMIDASPELELFDEELWCEPLREIGVVTIADPYLSQWERSKSAQTISGEGKNAASESPNPLPRGEGTRIADALELLSNTVEQVLSDGKFPFVFGGEHSITAGAIRPYLRRHPDLIMLHFDAHADLRDGYMGEHYSHASALRRCLDDERLELVSCGIRNISQSEIPFLEANRHRIHIHWGKDKSLWRLEDILAPLKGRPVYITFDLDGFDASVMPATGTPEPGGLFWHDVMPILRGCMKVCDKVVGADINELAPIKGFHASDFLAAKLAYKIMSYWFLRHKLA